MTDQIKNLEKLGLVSGTKVKDIFKEYYADILLSPLDTYHTFIRNLWQRYPANSNNMNGKVFECLVACCLYRAGILPFYIQAKLAFIPNVNFDFVAYSKEYGPVVLSVKTSLRERYKQADLEGMMLRQVHRKSKSYLLTLDESEAFNVNEKINKGEVLGLDKVILATAPDFDLLILELQQAKMYMPGSVEVITGNKVIQ